jgi:hypothetical protein
VLVLVIENYSLAKPFTKRIEDENEYEDDDENEPKDELSPHPAALV